MIKDATITRQVRNVEAIEHLSWRAVDKDGDVLDLGERQFRLMGTIPADAYYGVQTARALENFPISGVLINHYPGFIES